MWYCVYYVHTDTFITQPAFYFQSYQTANATHHFVVKYEENNVTVRELLVKFIMSIWMRGNTGITRSLNFLF